MKYCDSLASELDKTQMLFTFNKRFGMALNSSQRFLGRFAGAAQVGAAELLSYTTRKLFGRRAVARNKTSNAVILISDGWARGKRVLRVSKRLRRRGIEVFVLAFSVRRRLRWNTKLVASKPISQHILFLKSHSELALLENKFKHQGNVGWHWSLLLFTCCP